MGTTLVSEELPDLTVAQVAKVLRCSDNTVHRLFDRKELDGFRLGDRSPRNIPVAALIEYMTSRGIPLERLKVVGIEP